MQLKHITLLFKGKSFFFFIYHERSNAINNMWRAIVIFNIKVFKFVDSVFVLICQFFHQTKLEVQTSPIRWRTKYNLSLMLLSSNNGNFLISIQNSKFKIISIQNGALQVFPDCYINNRIIVLCSFLFCSVVVMAMVMVMM